MTDAAIPPLAQPPDTPRGVDLDVVERGMRNVSGTDLTEAKEAVVEALLQLAVQKCTGEGPTGEFIFGVKPSSRLVSGFLLPRFDATGQGDETSDIHIATMGIDLQVAAGSLRRDRGCSRHLDLCADASHVGRLERPPPRHGAEVGVVA